MEIIEKVRNLSENIAKELDLEVYKVYFANEEMGKILHIELTKKGGVDLQSITAFTKIINPKLDEFTELDFKYSLDVSSPGAERFIEMNELPNLVDEFVEVKFGQESILGTIIDVNDTDVTIKHFIKGKPKKTKILIADLKSVQLRIKF
ncbi:MAG: hypothetical protein WCR63_03970 [Bacilli bacterium]